MTEGDSKIAECLQRPELSLSLCVRGIGSLNKINKPACVSVCRKECMSVLGGGDGGGVCICVQVRELLPRRDVLFLHINY